MRQQSYRTEGTGKLFLVPTPIGNLEDMTFRAVNTLRAVDLILAEDTRHTQKLLNHFEIETPQKSFHEHNTQERIPQVIEWLQEGKNIAQVSDAGTPSISDPGFELVQACVEVGLPVIPLPGRMRELRLLSQADSFLNRSISMGSYHVKRKKKSLHSSNCARIARL